MTDKCPSCGTEDSVESVCAVVHFWIDGDEFQEKIDVEACTECKELIMSV